VEGGGVVPSGGADRVDLTGDAERSRCARVTSSEETSLVASFPARAEALDVIRSLRCCSLVPMGLLLVQDGRDLETVLV
jgi:hypothetical protein